MCLGDGCWPSLNPLRICLGGLGGNQCDEVSVVSLLICARDADTLKTIFLGTNV